MKNIAVIIGILLLFSGCAVYPGWLSDFYSKIKEEERQNSSISGNLHKVVGTYGTYNVIASNMTQIGLFAVGETEDSFIFYYQFTENFTRGLYLTTIGLNDNSSGGISGKWTWGWSDKPRMYNQATNFLEIKVNMATGFESNVDLINKMEFGMFQLMTNDFTSEMVINSMGGGSNYGAFQTTGDRELEIKIYKSTINEFNTHSLSDFSFFVGKWGIESWLMGVDGLTAGEYEPSDNAAGLNYIDYYIKFSNKMVVKRSGSIIEGSVINSPNTKNWTLSNLTQVLSTNITVSIYDPDNTNTFINISIIHSITNVTQDTNNYTLNFIPSLDRFVAILGFATNSASSDKILIDSNYNTTLGFIYYDDSVSYWITDTMSIIYSTNINILLTNIYVASTPYTGWVSIPNSLNAFDNNAWSCYVTSGYTLTDIVIPYDQFPNKAGITGKFVQTGTWNIIDRGDVGGNPYEFPSFIGFDPNIQRIVIDGSTDPATIMILSK